MLLQHYVTSRLKSKLLLQNLKTLLYYCYLRTAVLAEMNWQDEEEEKYLSNK